MQGAAQRLHDGLRIGLLGQAHREVEGALKPRRLQLEADSLERLGRGDLVSASTCDERAGDREEREENQRAPHHGEAENACVGSQMQIGEPGGVARSRGPTPCSTQARR